MYLGKRIRRVRLLKGLSQSELCKGIISSSHYSNIETGRYTPITDTLASLANKLSVPESYFIKWGEECLNLKKLIQVYEEKIETGDKKETLAFYQLNKKNFEYIPSIEQEIQFNLLRCIEIIHFGDIEQAISHYEKNIIWLESSIPALDFQLQQRYYYVSGLYNFSNKKYSKSIDSFEKTLSFNRSNQLKAKISFNISLALFHLYNYKEALLYVKKASKLYLGLHNWEKVGDCYNLIAVLLRELKLLDESEDYIARGFSIANEDSYELLSKLYHNLSLIQLDRLDYDAALENIDKSISIKEKAGTEDCFISYRVKLNIFLTTKNILSIKSTLEIARLQIRSKIDNAHYLYSKAILFYLLEDFTAYERNIEQSIDIYYAEESWNNLRTATEHYSGYLKVIRRYKRAFEIQEICTFATKNFYLRSDN